MRGKIRLGALVAASLLAAGASFAQGQPGKRPNSGIGNRGSIGPSGAPPGPARPAGPDLEVKNVELSGLQGRTARLNLFLGKPGAGQHQDAVKVFWVEGANRTLLWQGNTRFAGGATGYRHQVNVDLPARRGPNGHIEVVAGDQGSDANWRNNVKRLEFDGGDLVFPDRPEIEMISGGRPNRKLRLKVRNEGPGNIDGSCKVVLKIAERGPARTIDKSLPALRAGQDATIEQPYHFERGSSRDHNTMEARIVCGKDLVPGNNSTRTGLR